MHCGWWVISRRGFSDSFLVHPNVYKDQKLPCSWLFCFYWPRFWYVSNREWCSVNPLLLRQREIYHMQYNGFVFWCLLHIRHCWQLTFMTRKKYFLWTRNIKSWFDLIISSYSLERSNNHETTNYHNNVLYVNYIFFIFDGNYIMISNSW